MKEIWIEAESFRELGGWVIDQQSMETLHSSYIMAHGMGVPVADAVTEFTIEKEGTYHFWVLTHDWTAVWDVKNPAGRFDMLVDGNALPDTLGNRGRDWAWQKAGTAELKPGLHSLSLRDLTGFNGRCDAVYITDSNAEPGNTADEIDALRKRLGWIDIVADTEHYNLCVVGGGVAGVCTALSAISAGCSVLLIEDRGVLGGCNSSEIRVCMGGMIHEGPYNKLGDVVAEIAPVMGHPSIYRADYFEDHRKAAAFEARNEYGQAKYRLALNESVTDCEKAGDNIVSVVSTNTVTGKKTRFFADLFADCSGDAVLSRLAGAEVMYGCEAREVFGESLAPIKAKKQVMGHSIRWCTKKQDRATSFPDIDWNLNITEQNCMDVLSGDWEQETGFTRDMVTEIEYIRDYGLRAIYANWSFQKNHFSKKDEYANYTLDWVSAIGGKRESYRVKGDYILNQNDVTGHIPYEDATSCMSWSIDMHYPEIDNEAEFGEAFRSFAYHRGIEWPYQVPYRCLYAKDIGNLFLGGRSVSASHVAFSSIRVMRTLGQLGEVVGIAAGICHRNGCLPREVYTRYLSELKEKMTEGVPIPSAFGCGTGREECYHFKDAGYLYLNPYSCEHEEYLDKFKRGIQKLGVEHKNPLPDELK